MLSIAGDQHSLVSESDGGYEQVGVFEPFAPFFQFSPYLTKASDSLRIETKDVKGLEELPDEMSVVRRG